MALTGKSIEILLDLLEIKLGSMVVQDRDDTKELLRLRYCRQELLDLLANLFSQRSEKSSRVKLPRHAIQMLQRQRKM